MMLINKIIGITVGADLSRPSPIYRPSVDAPISRFICLSALSGHFAGWLERKIGKYLWNITLADWEETFAVNVTGAYLCCRAFLPGMIEQRSGSIIIIGSMTAKRPLYGRTPYAGSKLALVGIARTLAWEVGSHGIRVNVISPGAVEGERIERVVRNQAAAQGISEEEALRQFTSSSPLGRLVPPGDIAAAAIFLASDRAASISGEDLNVSAGTVMY